MGELPAREKIAQPQSENMSIVKAVAGDGDVRFVDKGES
jgi:hypothetical protein